MKNLVLLAPLFSGALLMLLAIVSSLSHATAGDLILKKATFAGGCFWCMEKPFEAIDGVISVTSGYTAGTTRNPTYDNYASGDHIEVVEILFDPNRISYAELLDVYWRQIDPTDPDGQFADRGHAYTTAIFFHDEEQRLAAEKSKAKLIDSGLFEQKIVTPILPATEFFAAEDYHQDYYKTNPIRYNVYRLGSGRDSFLKKIWKDKELKGVAGDQESLRQRLTPLQFHVTQEEGTEPPFKNQYWDNKKEGIYVDIVSGVPLFSSLDKYDSRTGWPSFTQPLVPENIVERIDRQLFSVRTEVRSRQGDSHLGHVFDDGPPPTGKRYCMNSAALRFIPADKLQEEGLGQFLPLFEQVH